MNRCKHCGKEIAEDRQFCSRSCSNKHRERKPWTEEQRQNTSIKRRIRNDQQRMQEGREQYYRVDGSGTLDRYCQYCSKILDRNKGERRTCLEHRGMLKRLQSLRKLACTKGLSDLDAHEVGMSFLRTEYINNQKSITQIARETGLWEVSIKGLLNVQGVQLRTFAEADQVALETGRRRLQTSPKYQHGTHTSWEGKEIYYRSSYELEYAQQLDRQKVGYEVESKRIRYYDTVQQKERVAIPDFYLPDTNELVEIKSSWTYNEQNMKDKFKAYRDSGYNPILILNKKQMPL